MTRRVRSRDWKVYRGSGRTTAAAESDEPKGERGLGDGDVSRPEQAFDPSAICEDVLEILHDAERGLQGIMRLLREYADEHLGSRI
jgi:hypothetical protein